MLTVALFVNGKVIFRLDAVNKGQHRYAKRTKYQLSDGRVVLHRRADGAVRLAIKMLEGCALEDDIKEILMRMTQLERSKHAKRKNASVG